MKYSSSAFPLSTLVLFAWRNLWRHRRRTIITLVSIALGFSLAVLSIGLQDGSHNSMVRNAISMGDGYLTIQPRGYLQSPSNHLFIQGGKFIEQQLLSVNLEATIAPRVALQVLASTANNSIGAGLQGFLVEQDPRSLKLKEDLIEGKWIAAGDKRGVLIGAGMARKLKAKVGSKIVLMIGKKGGESEAQLGRVRGIFRSGMDEMDNYLILSDLGFAQHFLYAEGGDKELQPVTRFALFLDDPESMLSWQQQLKAVVDDGQTVVLSWREIMPDLVQFIIVDDMGAYIMLAMILVIIVFGIVNTVLMSVLERTREFGLLRALGLSRSYLLLLVFFETVVMSFMAVIVGWIVGGGLHLYFAMNGIDFSAMVPEGTQLMGTVMDPIIYTELSSDRVVQLTVVIFVTTLATGIYPAIKAARITPVEALRT